MSITLTEKVMIINIETIKPSSPTPPEKRTLKLSLVDQLMLSYRMPLLFAYPSNGNITPQIFQRLKTSLSQTLALFYPLAGRVVENSYVDCDDRGAEFVEAEIRSDLSEFFTNPDVKKLVQFLPTFACEASLVESRLVLVQATLFGCGGVVVAVCISHKIGDATLMSTFLKCWSAITRGDQLNEELIPVFVGDSYIPQLNVPIPELDLSFLQISNCEPKTFVFESTKLKDLKAKVVGSYNINLGENNLTRFEIVTALIWKCAIKASRAKIGRLRPSMIYFPVNLRKRFSPPLPNTYTGNLITICNAKMHQDCYEIDLKGLINELKKGICSISNEVDNKKVFLQNDIMETHSHYFNKVLTFSDDVDYYSVTSWCNFGLYEIDFGWGKPTWLNTASGGGKNVVILMDTKDGKGIEVLVSLDKEEMTLFKSDPELLEFAKVVN